MRETYAWMCVFNLYVCAWICERMYACACNYLCACMYVPEWVHVCACVRACTCVLACMRVRVFAYPSQRRYAVIITSPWPAKAGSQAAAIQPAVTRVNLKSISNSKQLCITYSSDNSILTTTTWKGVKGVTLKEFSCCTPIKGCFVIAMFHSCIFHKSKHTSANK